MALVHGERVRETTATEGDGGVYELLGAFDASHQTFVDGVGDTNACYYQVKGGDDWETGKATVGAGSPDNLTVIEIYNSSNGGFAVDWGPGTKEIWNGAPGAQFVGREELGNAGFKDTDTDGTLTANSDALIPTQKAVKSYVDAIAVNLGKRQRVRVATTGNITISTALNNGDTVDGVSLVTGDLVAVKDQSTASQNGIYVAGVTPVRAAEFDTYDEHPGSLISVAEGTANADTLWLCTSNAGGTLNTTAIAFSKLVFFTLADLMALVDPAAMSESGGNLTFDVDDGNKLYRTRTMAGNETLLALTNMPNGATADAYVDPTGNSSAAPVLVTADAQTSELTSDGTSFPITMPSNIKRGNLITVGIACDEAPTIGIDTAASGFKWVMLPQESNSTVVTGVVLAKIAEGPDKAGNPRDALTVTFLSSQQASAIADRITNFNINAAVEGASANGSSTNSDPPNLAMLDGVSRARAWLAYRMGDAQVDATVAPSGYSNLLTKVATNAAGASVARAWRTNTASSENPGSFTSAAEQWAAFTLGVSPSGLYDMAFEAGKFRDNTPVIYGKTLLRIKKFGTDDFGVIDHWTEAA